MAKLTPSDFLTLAIFLVTAAQAAIAYYIYKLQKTVETARNACIIYIRAFSEGPQVWAPVTNLSDYNVWLEEMRLVVSRTKFSQPEIRCVARDLHIPKGESLKSIEIFPHILMVNGNHQEEADMDFHIEVTVFARDHQEIHRSPKYNVSWGLMPGQRRASLPKVRVISSEVTHHISDNQISS